MGVNKRVYGRKNKAKIVNAFPTVFGRFYGSLWDVYGQELQGMIVDVHDFWIIGRVPEPKNQYYLSLGTPGRLKQMKKKPNFFLQITTF